MSTVPPEPSGLFSMLAGGRQAPSVLERYYNGVDLEGAAKILDSSRVANPFAGIPVASSSAEFFESVRIFDEESGVFMDEDDADLYSQARPTRGANYNFDPSFGGFPSPLHAPGGGSGDPAQLSVVPTSTTDPSRPRTVAAGWDRERKCLTVVFRDGTYYNYYGVDSREWNNFKRARSKGRFIYTYLDQKSRGVADVSTLTATARETLYKLTRTGQIQRQGVTGTQKLGYQKNVKRLYQKGTLGGTGRSRLKKLTG